MPIMPVSMDDHVTIFTYAFLNCGSAVAFRMQGGAPSPASTGSVIPVEEKGDASLGNIDSQPQVSEKWGVESELGNSSKRTSRGVASELAKTCLRALKESSDVFPPLKSVVGGILFFFDNHEVCG